MNHPYDKYSKKAVIALIKEYGEVEDIKKDFLGSGEDIYTLSNGETIRLCSDYSRIDIEYIAQIARVKLELPQMEFDYWLGEQDKPS